MRDETRDLCLKAGFSEIQIQEYLKGKKRGKARKNKLRKQMKLKPPAKIFLGLNTCKM